MENSFFYGSAELDKPVFRDLANDMSLPYLVLAIKEIKNYKKNANKYFDYYKKGKHPKICKGIAKCLENLTLQEAKKVVRAIETLEKRKDIKNYITVNKIKIDTFTFNNKDLKLWAKKCVDKRINILQQEIIPLVPRVPLDKQGNPIPPNPTPNPNRFLNIYMKSLKAIDLTNWEPGSDEISASFVNMDENFSATQYGPFQVGSYSRNGQIEPSTGPILIKSFPLNINYTLPKIFTCTASIAEVDCGGFAKFMEAVWAFVCGDLAVAIFNALAQNSVLTATAVVAGCSTALAALLVIIAACVIALVAVFIISAIIQALKDDVFDPFTFVEGLVSPCGMLSNGAMTKEVKNIYEKHGGKYEITMILELIK